jgi:hypothetical protein
MFNSKPNPYKVRHLILKFLKEKYYELNDDNIIGTKKAHDFPFSKLEITHELGIKYEIVNEQVDYLTDTNEIKVFENKVENIVKFYITKDGLKSYADEKYINELNRLTTQNNSWKLSIISILTSIVLPFIISNVNNKNAEIKKTLEIQNKELKQSVSALETRIYYLEDANKKKKISRK